MVKLYQKCQYKCPNPVVFDDFQLNSIDFWLNSINFWSNSNLDSNSVSEFVFELKNRLKFDLNLIKTKFYFQVD